MASIAFIGLGRMGQGMAARLVDTGHQLSVFNRTASKADSLVRRGVRLADTPKQACIGADMVFSMTADDSSSRAVWLGPDGILAANMAPGGFAIECSTLSHDWVMELAAEAAARGLRYIDAPVTGPPEDAARGALTLLVGANPDDLDSARPVLAALSHRIIRFGPIGAGTTYKLVINMIGAVQIASAAEGLAIAQRAGLDLGTVSEAISTSQAASPQVVRNVRRMAEDDHDQNVLFTSALRLKDVEYALRLARQLRIGSPFALVARNALRELCELGHEQANESRVFAVAQIQRPGE